MQGFCAESFAGSFINIFRMISLVFGHIQIVKFLLPSQRQGAQQYGLMSRAQGSEAMLQTCGRARERIQLS